MVIIISGAILAIRLMNKEIISAKRKSNFVSNISHELKTPLTSINMFADMLLMGLYNSKDDYNEYLSIIQKECKRLMKLVDKVINYSRLESGKTEFQYKTLTEVVWD
ncbi:MAG: histidine kinase dimerization/phospho-acceptor domain-containing protein [Candidatus Poribacteria bacterium]